MEIVWDVNNDDDRLEVISTPHHPEEMSQGADVSILEEEIADLRHQLKQWKNRAEVLEMRSQLMERNWDEAREQKSKVAHELEAASGENTRLKSALEQERMKPWWKKLFMKKK